MRCNNRIFKRTVRLKNIMLFYYIPDRVFSSLQKCIRRIGTRVQLLILYWFSKMLYFRGLERINRGVLAVKINVILILCWCSSPSDISVPAPWRFLKNSSKDFPYLLYDSQFSKVYNSYWRQKLPTVYYYLYLANLRDSFQVIDLINLECVCVKMIIDGKMFVGIHINNKELKYTERLFVRVNHKNELYFSIISFQNETNRDYVTEMLIVVFKRQS